MTNPDPLTTYLQELQRNLSTGSATEHTHRSALKALLEALGDGVQAINEPQRIECGAPDYIITRARTPIGYIEAKDIGISLARTWIFERAPASSEPIAESYLARRIEQLDTQIDGLVYKLYGLTEKEVGVMERWNH